MLAPNCLPHRVGSDIYDNDEGDNDYFDDDDNDDDSNNIYDDTNNNNDSDDDDNNNNDNDDDRTIKLSFRKASISSEIRSFSVETILSYQHFKTVLFKHRWSSPGAVASSGRDN